MVVLLNRNPRKQQNSMVSSLTILKELATELGPIFAHQFQQSINSGEIPKELTLANISPLFKKGDRSLACNYRPVSRDLCTLQVTGTHSMLKHHGPP